MVFIQFKWKKELLGNAEAVFEKGENINACYEAKEAKLHQQIGKLSVENDWL